MVHTTFYRLPEEKKSLIIDAARREFLALGYEKSSINRILKDAHVPKGSFYQYFDNKEDLFYLCIRAIAEKLLTARKNNKESLLYTGLLRAREIGYPESSFLYTSEVKSYLTANDLELYQKLIDSPTSTRNYLLTEISAELIAPVVEQELRSGPHIRPGAELKFSAYLLAMSEVLAMDYGVRHNLDNPEMLKLSYSYMKAVYESLLL